MTINTAKREEFLMWKRQYLKKMMTLKDEAGHELEHKWRDWTLIRVGRYIVSYSRIR